MAVDFSDDVFAVNGAIDPAPGLIDFFGLFDLVSHEVGHCLTVGHVGDGAEGEWGGLPPNDIMAYHSDPPGRTKCGSTLDASITGEAIDCPQPDLGLVPGNRTDWTP